jgi:hypothetical protein
MLKKELCSDGDHSVLVVAKSFIKSSRFLILIEKNMIVAATINNIKK